MELKSKPLDLWANNLKTMPRDIWLWISQETNNLRPDTRCFAVDDGIDLSPDEQAQREVDLEKSGLVCFFHKDQLEDIEQNLMAQKKEYDQRDLYAAINYYWKHDAFINLGNV
ncbi:DUF7716 domain-containing protein [Halomonas sp. AOP12-C2-37]|uniref:DUF7716 domain-containing protein n=1 Tax=unclassified Halomonas TaxID=2609666 RepID=UPI00403335EE